MLRGVDLTLPAYSRSDYSREEIVALLKAQEPDAPLDLSGKSLNGADLSGLDFSHVNLRAARLVKTRLSGAKLDGAILDQAWMLEADLTGASLVGAHLFSAQLQRARADGADFSRARIAGDLTGASLRGAKFIEANMAADMKNQSMGLMRAVLASAIAEGADFTAADLMSADLRYLHAAGADFSGASMQGADAAGADFTGAKWDGAKVSGLDLDSARIDDDAAALLKDAKGLEAPRAPNDGGRHPHRRRPWRNQDRSDCARRRRQGSGEPPRGDPRRMIMRRSRAPSPISRARWKAKPGAAPASAIGMPGAISPRTGLVKNSNTAALNGRPFDRDMAAALGRPARIENDANCFALSEAVDGAGAGARVVFGVILGTGVGGGLVMDGALMSGRNRIAGEWGHNPLPLMREGEYPGRRCYCGHDGCIETFLCGGGLSREFYARAGVSLKGEEIAARADAGDAHALAQPRRLSRPAGAGAGKRRQHRRSRRDRARRRPLEHRAAV